MNNGDINIFSFIWKNDIIVRNFTLIKERRTILAAYYTAIQSNEMVIADYLWNLTSKWMKPRVTEWLFP
jgi:hypothetical protein